MAGDPGASERWAAVDRYVADLLLAPDPVLDAALEANAAAGLPPHADGRLVTHEIDPAYAEVARDNLRRAGFDDRVDVRVGPALDTLGALVAEGLGPFDLVFIDADKPNNPGYLRAALELSRPGTVMVGDNVVREGSLADGDSGDPRVQGVRAFHELLAADPRVDATTTQTVGAKGYDGFTLALVADLADED